MAEKKKSVPVVAAPTTDKKKALETAIARIEKDYGKGTIMRLGDDIPVNVESLSTGSLSLDLALGIGGVPPRPAAAARRGERAPGDCGDNEYYVYDVRVDMMVGSVWLRATVSA